MAGSDRRPLAEQHKTTRREARSIEESIRSWPGLIRYPGEFVLPDRVVDPFPQLPQMGGCANWSPVIANTPIHRTKLKGYEEALAFRTRRMFG
jgi:hypothetical protein